jgi:hypothetical protein
MINLSALILGALIAAELIALVARRAWVHWKLGHRAPLVDDAITSLADALVIGVVIVRPQGRTARRAFRLAALELFPMLAGESRRELARIVDEIGLVDDVSGRWSVRRAPTRGERRPTSWQRSRASGPFPRSSRRSATATGSCGSRPSALWRQCLALTGSSG